jgi:hypothetical protein
VVSVLPGFAAITETLTNPLASAAPINLIELFINHIPAFEKALSYMVEIQP